MTFADHVLFFYKSLKITARLPKGVEVLNPYQNDQAFDLCTRFHRKYYDDSRERVMIVGINPGRFGAGITGIPFSDPIKLEKYCGIANDLPKKAELSADFIHSMILAYGGHEKFYGDYYFTSVSPLGFIRDGRNLNYYDQPTLTKNLKTFIIGSLRSQLAFGISTSVAYCLGEGENFRFMNRLNEEEKFFEQIIPLAHPRFIMQYRRKHVGIYIEDYLRKLLRQP
jgi:hypothetical protein